LGGIPAIVPDVPISAVLLVLYLVLGIIHIRIFKNNKGRGHKFIFNGAMLGMYPFPTSIFYLSDSWLTTTGLCKIRVVTMSLRIAWACYPRNVSVALAANIFVYIGTIILYLMNWVFVQRIVRAQHTRLGWSTAYRIFHRGVLACLALSLFCLVIAAVWQAFTLNPEKLRVFRDMQLTGQTYFTFICFAPIILVLISLALPRHEVEKFGAGRLRINITILVLSVAVLSTGQIFRCVTTWLPPAPLSRAGQPVAPPWYYHKACFYAFNFVTELIVIVMYAVVRIDLRFHVPNGSKMAGDYSNRNSLASVNNILATEKAIKTTLASMSHIDSSSETIHTYAASVSVFDDTNTLADSLQYPSSTLTIDQKTGNWKVKRASSGGSSSQRSSQSSLHLERNTLVGQDIPPVPELPTAWPLPMSKQPRHSMPVLEHTNSYSSRATSKRSEQSGNRTKTTRFELKDHALNDVDINNAISNTLNLLEANSEKNKLSSDTSSPQDFDGDTASSTSGAPSSSGRATSSSSKHISFLYPSPRRTFPPASALKTSSHASQTTAPVRKPRVYVPSYPPGTHHPAGTHRVSTVTPSSEAAESTATTEAVSVPASEPASEPEPEPITRSRAPSLDVIKLADNSSRRYNNNPRILDVSLPTQESVPGSEFNSTRCSSMTRKTMPQGSVVDDGNNSSNQSPTANDTTNMADAVERTYSPSNYTSRTASSEAVRSGDAFRGFSFDAGRIV
jgi:hypothetical protein